MTRFSRSLFPVLMLAASLALAGCESSEDRAERHYKSGLELLAAGDEDRALVEFRNVFKYNGFHKEARQTYADILMKNGQTGEAYGQYLRLIEQYPDTVEVRRTLAELAFARSDWAEVERHGRAALALTPEDPGIKAIGLALDYRTASLAKDEPARGRIAADVGALLDQHPDNLVARRIVIDNLSSGPTPAAALPEIEAALQIDPDSLEFHSMKFQLLARMEDLPGSGAQLRLMFDKFPDNQEVRSALIRWYLVQGDIDGAEAFLRQVAGAATGDPAGHLAVIQLLQTSGRADAARAELERLLAANTVGENRANADLYRAMIATIDFDAGRQTEAMAQMEDILKGAEASDQTRRIKVLLARMLSGTGNQVGARARVEEVLAEDATHVEALKLRAAWLIADDKPGEAIIDLRAALGQNPRDAATLMLMAEAHERDGSPELAGERLALAVEVSGGGAQESLRYARFLLAQKRTAAAETVLVDARRRNPLSPEILAELGRLLLNTKDWARAQEVITQLGALDAPQAREAAQTLQAALMLAQDRNEDSMAFLQSRIDRGEGSVSTVALMVQTQVRSGKTDEARSYLDDALAKDPQNSDLRMLSASLHMLMEQPDQAEAIWRALIAENPGAEPPLRMLYGMLTRAGRMDDARALVDEGLAARPKSDLLRWMKAGMLEQSGQIDAAIAVYEEIYADNSGNAVVANNLASLITTHRDDAASLERAFAIARRLRGSDVPAFQDTYGWIEYRRGNLTEALSQLEPAARGLPRDPQVQAHLGLTYAGLNRPDEAIPVLRLALELAGDAPLPVMQAVRETLARLEAAAPAPKP